MQCGTVYPCNLGFNRNSGIPGTEGAHESLQNEIASLDAQNLSLSKEIRLLQSDNKYVEKVIRQRLHYVRDNEILYIFGKQ